MLQHYFDLDLEYEQKYGPKTAILYQCGGFYEIYGNMDDERSRNKMNRIQELTNLSVSRKSSKKVFKNVVMAGFPLFAFEKWKDVLIRESYTIVKVKQKENNVKDPERFIEEIISPGLNLESNNLYSNNLMSIYIEGIQSNNKKQTFIGISIIDIRTSENFIYEIKPILDDNMYSLNELFRLIQSFNPIEILIHIQNNEQLTEEYLVKFLEIQDIKIHFNYYKNKSYLLQNQVKYEILTRAFPDIGILDIYEYLDIHMKHFAQISYIYLLQFAHEHNETIILKLKKPSVNYESKHLILSFDSINQLNIVPNFKSKNTRHNSILNLVNNTSTPMGRRQLKYYILNPIIDTQEIQKRYDLCEYMLKEDSEGNKVFEKYESHLDKIIDIEKYQRKLTLKSIEPMSFISLDISYKYIQKIIESVETEHPYLTFLLPDKSILQSFHEFVDDYNSKLVLSKLNNITRSSIKENIFKKGIYKELDEIQDEINLNLNKINSFAVFICNYISIDPYGFKMDKDGVYYFSLTLNRSKLLKKKLKETKKDIIEIKFEIENSRKTLKIDKNYLNFKNSKQSSKLTCPEIDNISDKLNNLHLKLMRKCSRFFHTLMNEYESKYIKILEKISEFICYFDFIKSNAKTAFKYRFFKPTISNIHNDTSYIKAHNLRHPLIEAINMKLEYVPNDVNLGLDEKGILLYGVNAVGKSSYMKSVGIAIILAQSGLFVPSDKFEYYPYKQLFTRISGNDNIFKSQSTFAVEMSEMRSILKKADEYSLVLGDELCSGTETISGLSLVASGIITLHKLKSSFIFATHLHQLSELKRVQELEGIQNYHMETIYDEEKQLLVYNRKLKKGSGNAIYGLEVAKAMDMDKDFIFLANKIRQEILNIDDDIVNHKNSKYNANIIVNKCKICNSRAEEVHHIKPQRDADKDNMIGNHHKNVDHNLISLCHDCHQKTENGNLEIKGYIQTTKGIQVDYNFMSEEDTKQKSKTRKKYNEETVKKIQSFKPSTGKYNLSQSKKLIELNLGIKMSTKLIKKMWDNKY